MAGKEILEALASFLVLKIIYFGSLEVTGYRLCYFSSSIPGLHEKISVAALCKSTLVQYYIQKPFL